MSEVIAFSFQNQSRHFKKNDGRLTYQLQSFQKNVNEGLEITHDCREILRFGHFQTTMSGRRRVSFFLPYNKDENRIPSDMKHVTLENTKNLWYTKEEILQFKKRTKTCVIERGLSDNNNDYSGLERYLDPRRSKFKKSAVYYTLKSQSFNRDPEFTREVSRRCTSWAKKLAIQQGFEDFCSAYAGESFLESSSNRNEDYEHSKEGKRERIKPVSENRRVRRRTVSSSA